jgi:hypothetical protein
VTIHKIERENWADVCAQISRIGSSKGECAEIEIAGVHLGDQIATKWLPLFGVTYSRRDDAVEIALKSLCHTIRHPTNIFLEEHSDSLLSICVADREGMPHIVRLSEPLDFPAGTWSSASQ